jgi:hypothetical protein
MVSGVIRKRIFWDEVRSMKKCVERLAGCNKIWDTEIYEANNVKVPVKGVPILYDTVCHMARCFKTFITYLNGNKK